MVFASFASNLVTERTAIPIEIEHEKKNCEQN